MREIRFLRKKDAAGKIKFTDIAADSFNAQEYGKTKTEFMAQIQGRMADGSWVTGVDVFRQLYAAVGFKKSVAVTRLPLIKQLLSAGYFVFAKNRLRITGRGACEEDVCRIPEPS